MSVSSELSTLVFAFEANSSPYASEMVNSGLTPVMSEGPLSWYENKTEVVKMVKEGAGDIKPLRLIVPYVGLALSLTLR